MRREKRDVRAFYDTFGWRRNSEGMYFDTINFVDARPVVRHYHRLTNMRVNQYLRGHGRYFLDAGSGPIAHSEYLTYSDGYRHRICVDISLLALEQARSKLGKEGLCVQADLTALPFRDGVFDGTVCAHVLYHVPADEQARVVQELYRTLAPGSSCVTIYSRPHSFLRRLLANARQRLRCLRVQRGAAVEQPSTQGPPLYFHAHEYRWWLRTFPTDWEREIRTYRAVDDQMTRYLIPNNAMGRSILLLVFSLEEQFSGLIAKVARHPMIIMRKQ